MKYLITQDVMTETGIIKTSSLFDTLDEAEKARSENPLTEIFEIHNE